MNPNLSSSGPDDQTSPHDVQSTADTPAADAKSSTQAVVNVLKSEARDRAESAKESVAEEVSSVASALRTAAHELRAGSPQERTLGQIADGLADASEAIRDKDLGEIVHGVSGFARRNPAVFLGATALLGFAATRFAKASNTHRDSSEAAAPNFAATASTPSGPVPSGYSGDPT